MDYKKGTRIRHPEMPDWGLGQVLEDSAANLVSVFFVGVGEKKLSLKELDLECVADIDAAHPILDNLKITTDGSLRYRTLAECVQLFLVDYPSGFYGQKFGDNERDCKLKAHREMGKFLNQDVFKQLLTKGDYQEIYNRAIRHVSAMNLVHIYEKLALRNGLESSAGKQSFAEVLYSYLFGDAPFEQRFNEFAEFLDEFDAGKWTVVTFFSFVMFPDRHMFIKPTITKNAADICGFDIRYRPALNYATYAAVLKFSEFLKESLDDLKPRDMIDVQSFMWCIAPDE